MPATFVLNGVRSPRTYALSVTCCTCPPSQVFQLCVTVNRTARANSSTRIGVPYFCHLGVAFAATCRSSAGASDGGTGIGFGAGSGVAEDEWGIAIKSSPVTLGRSSRVTSLKSEPSILMQFQSKCDAEAELMPGATASTMPTVI